MTNSIGEFLHEQQFFVSLAILFIGSMLGQFSGGFFGSFLEGELCLRIGAFGHGGSDNFEESPLIIKLIGVIDVIHLLLIMTLAYKIAGIVEEKKPELKTLGRQIPLLIVIFLLVIPYALILVIYYLFLDIISTKNLWDANTLYVTEPMAIAQLLGMSIGVLISLGVSSWYRRKSASWDDRRRDRRRAEVHRRIPANYSE